MAIPPAPPLTDGGSAGSSGAIPGTAVSGLILREYVNLERRNGEEWDEVATAVPATFEPMGAGGRKDMEAWSHKPLCWLWLPGGTPIRDGDRAIRFDGSRWYARGTPLAAPFGTHVTALVEGAEEDGLYAARSAEEPL